MKKTVQTEIKNFIKVLNLNCSVLNCSVEEFKDKVNWSYISVYQKLSEDFIRKLVQDNLQKFMPDELIFIKMKLSLWTFR